MNIQRQHYAPQVWIHLGLLAEAVSEKEKVPSEHLFQINIDIDNDILNTQPPFHVNKKIQPTPINDVGTQFQSASYIHFAILNVPAESIDICITAVKPP